MNQTRTQVPAAPRRVWIDTDPAITSGNGEVDDGFALLQAFRSPELDVVGVSAVFGNTALENTYAMAKEVVAKRLSSNVPVYEGHAEGGERSENDATNALLDALEKGPLTIIALGPLTNVAAALSQKGALLSNIEEIVFVGGRRVGLEFRATADQETPFRDLNFELDPGAAEDLLKLDVSITLAGWEVSSQMWLESEHLAMMRQSGDPATAWLAEASQEWHDDWVKSFKAEGFTPFDTLAVGWILRPDLFEAHRWPSEVVYTPERPLLHADPATDGPYVTYLKNVDNARFRDDLMGRLLGV